MNCLFIVFGVHSSSDYTPTEMEYDKDFTKIKSNLFARIIENLEANSGKTLF